MMSSRKADDRVSVKKMKDFWEQKSAQDLPSLSQPVDSEMEISVKSITIGSKVIHEISLLCKCCHSQIIVRGGHDCDSGDNPGLEWLKETDGNDRLNLTL